MFDPYAHFECTTLTNGIPVYLHQVPECGYAYVDFVFKVGARHDDVQNAGMAHFVEHLVCANSQFDLADRKRFFSELGGSYHAFTSYFATWYGFVLPVKHKRFDEALSLWSDATLGGQLINHFDREKSVIESEIRRKYHSDEHRAFRTELNQLIYQGTFRSVSPSPAGTLESLSAISHECAMRFHSQYYTPANLLIVCVGDISMSDLAGKLERCLGSYVGGEASEKCSSYSSIPVRTENRLEYRDTHLVNPTRAQIYSSMVLPCTLPEGVVSIAASVISSVLTTELRDKRGLVYNTSAGGGPLVVCHHLYFGADEFAVEQLPTVEDVMRQTISSLPSLHDMFLQEQKTELLRYAMYDVPWVQVQNSAVEDLSMFGRIKSRREERDEYAALTLKDWQNVAEYLQDESRFFTSVIYK